MLHWHIHRHRLSAVATLLILEEMTMRAKGFFMKVCGLAMLMFLTSRAFGDQPLDIQQIRTMAPANYDIAQLQAALLQSVPEQDALAQSQRNYLYQDITHDGLPDLVVIFEENPRLRDWKADKQCERLDWSNNCVIAYGPRIINSYYGQADGSLKLANSKANYILSGDEGGFWGDPLVGVTTQSDQSFSIVVYGGSNWRWGFTDTVQFREGDLFVIGKASEGAFVVDGSFWSKSEDLLTGIVVEKSIENGAAPTIEKTYSVEVKPLVKFSDYQGQQE
jgi:hypothetical protein